MVDCIVKRQQHRTLKAFYLLDTLCTGLNCTRFFSAFGQTILIYDTPLFYAVGKDLTYYETSSFRSDVIDDDCMHSVSAS